jgi:stage V sporulation protein D (sporulation-specific penicillin-binding protein)
MSRIWSVYISLLIFFILIVCRLFFVQVVSGDSYQLQAAKQHFFELPIAANRGNIESSDGNKLVINQPSYLVYLEPRNIKDRGALISALSHYLGMDSSLINNLVDAPGRIWAPLVHKVGSEIVDTLSQLHLSGLGYEKESKRFYPEASTAAHLLGFVGADVNGTPKGYFGLEGYYDRELRGKPGMLIQEKDVQGNPIIVGDVKKVEAQDGRTLILWLDRSVQNIAETRLSDGIKKYGAKSGTIVIMNPQTGGILAMASFPTYDPADYEKYNRDLYRNPVVADSYEPGSTFKSLVMAAGIEENLISPDTMMDENGPVKIDQYQIRTWDNQYHGIISMTDVLVHSSNVGMVFIARKLGLPKMLSYLHAFGFGVPTGIDLEDEMSPDLRPDSDWKEIDLATVSFGQGIAVTPIQMVRAVSVIANGGMLVEPHVVQAVKDKNGEVVNIKTKNIRRVIKPQTASIMAEMMVAAVDRGEAKWAKPKGYRIAGKTGTAQIAVAGHYDDKKTIASFVGFAPADNPKFVMLVTLQEPSSSQWGSETAAPLFFGVSQDLFNYYGIPEQN